MTIRRFGPAVLVFVLWLAGCSGNPASKSAPAVTTLTTGDFRLRSYHKYSHPRFARVTALAAARDLAAPCSPVVPEQIHRFVEGEDVCVLPMSPSEVEEELGDPFATLLLRRGTFPESTDAIVDQLRQADPSLIRQSYVVGEGSQVPTTIAEREAPRNLRYVVSWGPSATSATIFLSTAPGRSSFHQVLAWDAGAGKFNFYQRIPQIDQNGPSVWTWAGDSTFAQRPASAGQGCFDCHHNGVPIMKELQFPWNNWHSEAAAISPTVAPETVAEEPLFENRIGAEQLEQTIQGGFQIYYKGWLRARFENRGGVIHLTDVPEMLRRLTANTTINLVSSGIESRGAQTSPPGRDVSGIPNDFFLWDTVLGTLLGLDYRIPQVSFARAAYDAYLEQHDFRLVQEGGDGSPLYEQPGSTHFSFFVPKPAQEDFFLISQLRSAGIVTDKLIAAILMVDFQHPVFSTRRAELQKHAEQIATGTIENGKSSVPSDFAGKVRAATAGQPACDLSRLEECSAEQQFLHTWELADDQWRPVVTARIQAYLDTIGGLAPEEQLDRLMRGSILRRRQLQTWPRVENLAEFSLLIPRTSFDEER